MSRIELHHLADGLEHWARRTPGATAIEDTAGRRLTYAELNAAANRMARRLLAAGVAPGDRVGICMPKSINSVTCVLGALKARAAYVPVDYSAPPERNRYIFADCQTRVICVDGPRRGAFDGHEPATPLLVLPGEANDGIGAPWLDEQGADDVPAGDRGPDDLSYILYTSGSTGRPKGVIHTHRSATSFVNWCGETFEPTAADRFSSHAPLHFDLSILDLYAPATAGAAIVLVGEALGKEPRDLAPFIAERRITVWYSVPSILAMLAQYGHLEQHDYAALRTVLFAGEVFPVKHLRALTKLWPGRAYYNLYGPTETNVCTFYRIPDAIDDARETPFPIGRACSNVRDAVLDESYRPVPRGEEGLLYIHQSGPVMRGYWNLPEQSARAFRRDEQGEAWYCTGDVVHTDAAGDYVFVGRRDRMVKRRGYRIELGEIEAGLYRHPQVREAAAIARQSDEDVTIWAYVSTKDGAKLSIIAMKQHCAQELPAYMNPDRFVFLDALPRTSTDKIDYQGLKALT